MKEFVDKLREKADIFEKSGCAVDGIVKDYRKSADMIEKLCGKSNIGGFVEKLIERLEEKSFIVQCADNRYHNFINIDKIKNTINQLAEEFATDINVGRKNQDSTKNNQGWILCSERLPESKVDVLVWKDNMYSVAWYQELTKYWLSNDFSANESKNVIAWQPLPEPYKPEEKQEEPQTNFYSERFNRVL